MKLLGTMPVTRWIVSPPVALVAAFGLAMLEAFAVRAQQPVIASVEKIADYTQSTVLISGSGFGSSAASIQVWFDQAQGNIITVSDNTIEVVAPPQARLHNVEVINLVSRLSAKSSLKFMSTFSGEGFSIAKLATPLTFTSGNAVFDICSCDLTGDNKPEIVGTKFENVSTDIVVLHNQSTPENLAFNAFDKTTLPVLNLNAPTGHITCGDLNGDGKPELVASRSGVTANGVFILQNTSASTPNFSPRVELLLDAGHFARQVAIHDLNADGKPEIIVTNSFNNVLYVFVNQSSGGVLNMAPTPLKINMSGVPNSLALEVQDMDGDKRPDIVMTQNQGSGLYVLKNISTTSVAFSSPTIIPIPGSFNDLSTADFNNDGLLDLAVTSVFNAQTLVLINKSTPTLITFAVPITLTTGNGPFGVDVSDINGDGFPDLIVPNRSVAAIDVFIHNQNFASPGFSRTTIATARTNWFVKAGDLDGDAKPDIAFTSFTSPTAYSIDILRNKNCYQPKILNDAALTLCVAQDASLKAVAAPGASFNWMRDGTSFQTGTDNFVQVTSAGSYTVAASSEGGACLLTSPPVVVSTSGAAAPAQPVLNSAATFCAGQTVSISTTAVPGATYIWTGPAGFSASETDATLSISNAAITHSGSYSLQVKVADCVSDPGKTTVQVIGLASFGVTSSAAGPVCQGQTVALSTNAVTGYSYQWMKGGADISGQTTNSLNVTQDGTYRVRISYSTCSFETQDQIVTVLTQPASNFTAMASACAGETLAFQSSGSVDTRGTVSYAWNFGDGDSANGATTTHAYTDAQTYQASLTTSYAGVTGCTSTKTAQLVITSALLPVIVSDVTQLCPGENVMLSLQAGYATVKWSNGATAATTSVSEPGTYSVNTVDDNGCAGSSELLLALSNTCGAIELLIPNMFSPNGDARNDRWVIDGLEAYQNCTVNVFDDKGVSVYKQSSYPVEGWDGSFNGKSLPDGVYYYVLSIPDQKPMTGSVTILR